MATTHLIRRSIAVFIVSTSLLTSPNVAYAAMAVTDGGAMVEAKLRLAELKKQLSEMNDMKNKLQDQINAIGEMGKITIPMINLPKIAGQLISDAQCLMPDFEGLMPSLNFDELSFGSICDGSNNYKKILWISPKEGAKLKGSERLKRYEEIRERRETLLVEAAADGMAQADMALEGALDLSETAAEIEAAAAAANNTNSRLAVIAQSQAVLIRASSQTNQLLAQQLRIQATFAMAAGVDVTNALADTEDDEDKAQGEQN